MLRAGCPKLRTNLGSPHMPAVPETWAQSLMSDPLLPGTGWVSGRCPGQVFYICEKSPLKFGKNTYFFAGLV